MYPLELDVSGLPRPFGVHWLEMRNSHDFEAWAARAAASPCGVLGCCWDLYLPDRLRMHLFLGQTLEQLAKPAIINGTAALVMSSEGKAFKKSFRRIWRALPDDARAALLRYWRQEVRGLASPWGGQWPYLPCWRPLIRVVEVADADEQKTIEHCAEGLILTFQGSECRASARPALECTILRQLLTVYRLSTQEQKKLKGETWIDPYYAWQDGEGANADDDEGEARWEELKSSYFRREEAAQRTLAGRWGLADVYSRGGAGRNREEAGKIVRPR
jgi:hypothetical protein